jgi:signal transduction histidine kinase
LLALTRIDNAVDRIAPAPLDLANLIQEVDSDGDFEARARQRKLAIEHSNRWMVIGFEELLRSGVGNVVRNAIRRTAEGTARGISAQARGVAGDAAGAGLPARSTRRDAHRNLTALPANRQRRFGRGRIG